MIEHNNIKFYTPEEIEVDPKLKSETEIVSKDGLVTLTFELHKTNSHEKVNPDTDYLCLNVTTNEKEFSDTQYIAFYDIKNIPLKSMTEVFNKLSKVKNLSGVIAEGQLHYISPFDFELSIEFTLNKMFNKPRCRLICFNQRLNIGLLGIEFAITIPWLSIYLALTGKIKKGNFGWIWK